jgi:hypothetical protein
MDEDDEVEVEEDGVHVFGDGDGDSRASVRVIALLMMTKSTIHIDESFSAQSWYARCLSGSLGIIIWQGLYLSITPTCGI